MSIVKEAARARGRARESAAPIEAPGSIREVSLVGRPPRRWAEGDRVAWAGRPYRVGGCEAGRYAHLRPEPAA